MDLNEKIKQHEEQDKRKYKQPLIGALLEHLKYPALIKYRKAFGDVPMPEFEEFLNKKYENCSLQEIRTLINRFQTNSFGILDNHNQINEYLYDVIKDFRDIK